ncbi:hypothetical protein INS49_004608 [Diaporthe citri]|uniref:uncharacterized protein n=1 Tax=Diaporthe citri TaxID=83186 RepID=UPI001C817408|nr:uncharacterized protein INS49_004608 [Diaporthe citri]KAG6354590.1 hypothetical protein INS49_004608 [Diaporthe citri]
MNIPKIWTVVIIQTSFGGLIYYSTNSFGCLTRKKHGRLVLATVNANTGREFLLDDVDDRSDVELNNALDATVQYISIEYLRQEEAEKPHVVFNFNCINSLELLTTNNQQSKGCRVSMDWTGEDDNGELKIKPRSYKGCQTFIRLCDFGVVSCFGDGITSRGVYLSFDEEIPRLGIPGDPTPYFGFFDVIHKDFVPVDAAASEVGTDLRVRIVDLPMHRGTFRDPVFRRKEEMYAFEIDGMAALSYVRNSQHGQQPDVGPRRP